jgi:hypothetical protein
MGVDDIFHLSQCTSDLWHFYSTAPHWPERRFAPHLSRVISTGMCRYCAAGIFPFAALPVFISVHPAGSRWRKIFHINESDKKALALRLLTFFLPSKMDGKYRPLTKMLRVHQSERLRRHFHWRRKKKISIWKICCLAGCVLFRTIKSFRRNPDQSITNTFASQKDVTAGVWKLFAAKWFVRSGWTQKIFCSAFQELSNSI